LAAPPSEIRVVLCDDVAELRSLMRAALEKDASLEVVGEAGTGREAAALAAELQPDVIVLDLSMPDMDGLEALPLIRALSPASAVLVFTGFGAAQMGRAALRRGAHRYMEKGSRMSVLAEAVREIGTNRDGNST
jgi:DNA-binding NarL/FixJ family response regulator